MKVNCNNGLLCSAKSTFNNLEFWYLIKSENHCWRQEPKYDVIPLFNTLQRGSYAILYFYTKSFFCNLLCITIFNSRFYAFQPWRCCFCLEVPSSPGPLLFLLQKPDLKLFSLPYFLPELITFSSVLVFTPCTIFFSSQPSPLPNIILRTDV